MNNKNHSNEDNNQEKVRPNIYKHHSFRRLRHAGASACVVVIVVMTLIIAGAFGGFGAFGSAHTTLSDEDSVDSELLGDEAIVDRDLITATEKENDFNYDYEYTYNDVSVPRPVVTDDEKGIEYRSSEIMITINEGDTVESINELLSHYDFIGTTDVSTQNLDLGFVIAITQDGTNLLDAVDTLRNDDIVASPNYVLSLSDNPAPSYSGSRTTDTELTDDYQWSMYSLNVPAAWNIQKASEGENGRVGVAVFDSGCRTTHNDLKDNILATYNAAYARKNTEGKDPFAAESVEDTNGHGTHVAGTVAAKAGNNIGLNGVSYDAGLVICKVVDDDGKVDMTNIAQAYLWLLSDDDGDGRTNAQEYNVRVVNMSITGKGTIDPENAFYRFVDAATEAGILSVASAGNSNTEKDIIPPYYSVPGDYPGCYEVINLNADTTGTPNDNADKFRMYRSSTSNFNTPAETETSPYTKDISAPGSTIWSTAIAADNAYIAKSGTSMASPAVAGASALIFAQDPSLTPTQVMDILNATANDVTGSGEWTQQYGYGMINPYRALQVMTADIELDKIEINTPTDLVLSFEDGTTLTDKQWRDSAKLNRDKWEWSVDNETIATINKETGEITANTTGKVNITATYMGIDKDEARARYAVTKEVEVEAASVANISDAIVSCEDPDNPGYIKQDTDELNLVYTGDEVTIPADTFTITHGENTLTENVDYRIEYVNNINAGIGTIKISALDGSNFIGEKTLHFVITPADIRDVECEDVSDAVYTGSAVEINPAITFNGHTLTRDVDYTLSFENNTEAGNKTAKMTVTATSPANAALSEEVSFLQEENIVEDNAGDNHSDIEDANDSIELVFASSTSGNFTGEKVVMFSISPVNIEDNEEISIEGIDTQYSYTGSAIAPIPTVKIGDKTLIQNSDYTIEYTNNVNAGNASLTISFAGNYSGSKEVSYVIAPIDINGATFGSIPEQKYTGSAVTPSVNVTFNGKALTLNTDYTVSYENNVDDGTNSARAIVTAAKNADGGWSGNFYGEKTITFSIVRDTPVVPPTPETIDITGATVTGIDSIYYFTGSAVTPTPTVKVNEVTLVALRDYMVTYENNMSVGTATVKIVGCGNYTGSISKTFTIKENETVNDIDLQNATVSIADNSDLRYTGSNVTPKVKVVLDGKTLTENVDYTLNYLTDCSQPNNQYYVLVRGIGDKTGSVRCYYSIQKRDINEVTISNIPNALYTGAPLYPRSENVYITFANGERYNLVENKDYILSYSSNTNPGMATAAFIGIGGYKGTKNVNFNIVADLVNSTVSVGSVTYTGNPVEPSVVVKMGNKTLVRDVDYTVRYYNNTNIGTANVVITGTGTYTGTKNATFTIKAKPTSSSQKPVENSDGSLNNMGAGNGSTGNSSGILINIPNNTSTTSTVDKVEANAMYRLYNPNSGEHFYTASIDERDFLDRIGWNYEGIAWYAPKTGDPVYRLYNPNSGDHHYTTSKVENDWLASIGWNAEGIGWCSGGSVSLYRLYNPNETVGTHHYTVSVDERDFLDRIGWNFEGIGWYGIDASKVKR